MSDPCSRPRSYGEAEDRWHYLTRRTDCMLSHLEHRRSHILRCFCLRAGECNDPIPAATQQRVQPGQSPTISDYLAPLPVQCIIPSTYKTQSIDFATRRPGACWVMVKLPNRAKSLVVSLLVLTLPSKQQISPRASISITLPYTLSRAAHLGSDRPCSTFSNYLFQLLVTLYPLCALLRPETRLFTRHHLFDQVSSNALRLLICSIGMDRPTHTLLN